MKVLVATRKTQGAREVDFSDTIDGELVFDSGPCGEVQDAENWDCRCSIGFWGVASGELTTTAIVADLPIGLREYERAVRDGVRSWCCSDCARSFAHDTRMVALRFPVGTVVERLRDQFCARPSSTSPR
ncbi:hypothetical protein [Salinibacterium sp. ZJ450]|uniref:DUF7715 family protein n=1 Tax=Salinibacterium sp. ZJ450 TaxID=2708338 RepID=UPI0014202B16|nr:hypothetical protein [Salinibacterium sp. ZJ450]